MHLTVCRDIRKTARLRKCGTVQKGSAAKADVMIGDNLLGDLNIKHVFLSKNSVCCSWSAMGLFQPVFIIVGSVAVV